MHILFVCSGNTCRSPMAAALMRSIAAEKGLAITADSAGLYATAGMGASQNAKKAMREHYGIDLSEHRSRLLTKEIAEGADLILCMTKAHEDALKKRFPGANAVLLGAWGGTDQDVPDPFGGDEACYLLCAQQLESLLKAALAGRAGEFNS